MLTSIMFMIYPAFVWLNHIFKSFKWFQFYFLPDKTGSI
jgi:hypothetical protein